MIKEDEIEIMGHSSNYKYYKSLGYDVLVRRNFIVKTIHLMKGSNVYITSICDICGEQCQNTFKDYYKYTNGLLDEYFCNKCNKVKSEKTSLEKYGVSNPMMSKTIKEKVKKTLLQRYGVDHYSKTSKFKEKTKETSLKKYNVSNYSKTNECKEKVVNSNLIRFGTHPSNCEFFKEKSKYKKERNTYKKYSKIIEEFYDTISYSNEVFSLKHKKCQELFTINKGLLYTRYNLNKCICTICNPIGIKYSSIEIDIKNFLFENNIKYISSNKDILNGKEIDIYLPDYNIAIEVNGVYWHSELFKDSNYHINKTKLCNEKDIELLHIWEDDWNTKTDIIKSILYNKLKINKNKIFARKCIIRKVDTNEYKDFLNKNHIQGYASSTENIGLYYNNELVSLMTFGWRRTNNKREFELIRFCNKLI